MTKASMALSSRPREHVVLEKWFATGLALTMLLVASAAFFPSIIHTESRRAPLTPLASAHGLVFFVWLGIFLLQSRLIATRRVASHRRFGVAACFVAALMLVLGYEACMAMARRGFDLSGDLHVGKDPLGDLIFPLTDLFNFACLVTAAIAYRRRPEIHRRLMLFANVVLMPAPLAHFIGHNPRLAALPAAIILVPISIFLLALIGRDFLLEKRVHPLTLILSVALFVSGPIRASVVGPSVAWHHFAAWLVR